MKLGETYQPLGKHFQKITQKLSKSNLSLLKESMQSFGDLDAENEFEYKIRLKLEREQNERKKSKQLSERDQSLLSSGI